MWDFSHTGPRLATHSFTRLCLDFGYPYYFHSLCLYVIFGTLYMWHLHCSFFLGHLTSNGFSQMFLASNLLSFKNAVWYNFSGYRVFRKIKKKLTGNLVENWVQSGHHRSVEHLEVAADILFLMLFVTY